MVQLQRRRRHVLHWLLRHRLQLTIMQDTSNANVMMRSISARVTACGVTLFGAPHKEGITAPIDPPRLLFLARAPLGRADVSATIVCCEAEVEYRRLCYPGHGPAR